MWGSMEKLFPYREDAPVSPSGEGKSPEGHSGLGRSGWKGLLPEGLAAGLQVGVDGFLAAYEVGHFRPDLFHRGLFPHVFVFQLRDLEAVVDEVFLGRVSYRR